MKNSPEEQTSSSTALMHLRGFQPWDFVSIFDLLYYERANVDQDDFDSFLAIAEEIQLKGPTSNLIEENKNQHTLPKLVLEH